MEQQIERIKKTIVQGKFREIKALVEEAIQGGIDLNMLINDAMIAAMDIVGNRFTKGDFFVPEMLVAAKTMKVGLESVKPLLKESENLSKEKIVLCTVKGDLHDIGKNLVAMMLEGAGFEIVDLGVDITSDIVLQKLNEVRPKVLGLSALLTTTMPEMQNIIDALNAKGIRDQVKIMVGGAPVSAAFAQDIGADAYGKDAAEAVAIARNFTKK
jgi:corrinoid protein of di/trimethylamine methyltransferase